MAVPSKYLRLVSSEHIHNIWYDVAIMVTTVQRPAEVDVAITVSITSLKSVRLRESVANFRLA